MSDSAPSHEFDEFRDDFVAYLAMRLGISHDEAQDFLGDWLRTFSADALCGKRWMGRGVGPAPEGEEMEVSEDAPASGKPSAADSLTERLK
jgi:hypothetical protein